MAKFLKTSVAAVGLAAAALFSGQASAQSSWQCVNASFSACAEATSGISWTYSSGVFTVSNTASDGYVAEIYFEMPAGSVAYNPTASSPSGVSFAITPASPANLPGGNSVTPKFITAFGFDSGNNVNGLSAGEFAAFTITGASSLDDFLGAGMRAGLHVRSLTDEGVSIGLITTPPIPEPETYALMLAGLGAVAFMARRRKAAQKA